MEVLNTVLSVCAFVFSGLALVAAGATAVIVLGWKHSTHTREYVQPATTTVEWDLPPGADSTAPKSMPLAQHQHEEDLDAAEAALGDDDF